MVLKQFTGKDTIYQEYDKIKNTQDLTPDQKKVQHQQLIMNPESWDIKEFLNYNHEMRDKQIYLLNKLLNTSICEILDMRLPAPNTPQGLTFLAAIKNMGAQTVQSLT